MKFICVWGKKIDSTIGQKILLFSKLQFFAYIDSTMDMQKNLKNEINSCSQNGMGNFA